MVRNPSCYVSDCWDEDGWDMDFRRALSVHEYNEWLELIESLNDVKPGGVDADIVIWALVSKIVNHALGNYPVDLSKGFFFMVTAGVAPY
jgi:hypothetical protein